MRVVRLTPRTAWRLTEIEPTPEPTRPVAEAEEFMFDGHAARYMRNRQSLLIAIDIGTLVAVGVAYSDPRFHHCTRLGSIVVDHRHRRAGYGRRLLNELLDESLRCEPYALWLVDSTSDAMLRLSRSHPCVKDEALTEGGYVQFFAERP